MEQRALDIAHNTLQAFVDEQRNHSGVKISFECIKKTAIDNFPVSAILQVEPGDDRDIKSMLDLGTIVGGKYRRIQFAQVSDTMFLTVDGTHELVKYQYVKSILNDFRPFILSKPIRWDKLTVLS